MDQKPKNNTPLRKKLNSRKGTIVVAVLCLLLILLMAFFSIWLSGRKTAGTSEIPQETPDEGTDRRDETAPSDVTVEDHSENFHSVVIEDIDPNEPSQSVEYVPGGSQFSYEDSSVVSVPNGAGYWNHVVTADVGYGMHLSLGVESSDYDDGLFINPQFVYDYLSPDPITGKHGVYYFIISCNSGEILYSARSSGPYDDYNNKGKTELFVTGRTYDDLVPATFHDEANYGAVWLCEPGIYPETGQSWTLSVRVIRADDGFLMAVAHADISYDEPTDCYSISRIYPADTALTGELDEITRDAAVTKALAFLASSDCKLDIGLDFEELAYNRDFICVERVFRPYYGKLYHVSGEVVAASALMRYQLYAVNIPLYGYGYFTVYMAPQEQVESYFASLPAEWTDLAVIGYDAKSPFSVYTFNAALREADREQFDINGG